MQHHTAAYTGGPGHVTWQHKSKGVSAHAQKKSFLGTLAANLVYTIRFGNKIDSFTHINPELWEGPTTGLLLKLLFH